MEISVFFNLMIKMLLISNEFKKCDKNSSSLQIIRLGHLQTFSNNKEKTINVLKDYHKK